MTLGSSILMAIVILLSFVIIFFQSLDQRDRRYYRIYGEAFEDYKDSGGPMDFNDFCRALEAKNSLESETDEGT
jgi:hypothetical protein